MPKKLEKIKSSNRLEIGWNFKIVGILKVVEKSLKVCYLGDCMWLRILDSNQ
jgi:hypothetical protein